MSFELDFYRGKKVLVTGHTGFKGGWLCKILQMAGADVTGYALEPLTGPSIFDICGIGQGMYSINGDIRDLKRLESIFDEIQPEIVFHLAAQPIVRESYRNPVYTYETNVMGTVNILECIRLHECVRSFINVTTDKVYKNREWDWGYRENEELNGHDPYSNSKSCSELVTDCYRKSFLYEGNTAISTCRAGNVIGGGDFAMNRIIPDCVRAAEDKKEIIVRNPYSVRPFQHVLEALGAYLMIARYQYEDKKYAGSYNVGPDETDCINTGRLVSLFCEKWEKFTGEKLAWREKTDGGPYEAGLLKLDCSRLKNTFGWKAVWQVEDALEKTAQWYVAYMRKENTAACMERQITEFFHDSFMG